MKPKTADYYELIKHLSEGYALHKMIFDKDKIPVDYEFTEVNDAFLEITDKKREDIVGKKASDVLPWFTKKSLKMETMNRYGKIAKVGGVVRLVNNYFTAYDKWMNVTAFSTGDGYFTTLVKDRTIETNLKTTNQYSEERYHTILETVPIAIVEADVTDILGMMQQTKKNVEDFDGFLVEHPNFYENARDLLDLRAVNNEAVRLFKAKSQKELVNILSSLISKKSRREWRRFFKGLWEKKDVIELEVTFKDCNSDE